MESKKVNEPSQVKSEYSIKSSSLFIYFFFFQKQAELELIIYQTRFAHFLIEQAQTCSLVT